MNTEVKSSIPISPDLLEEIKTVAKEQKQNIGEVVEKGLRDYLKKLMREKRNIRDIGIINCNIEELNKEAEENLEYQIDIWNEENFTELKSR